MRYFYITYIFEGGSGCYTLESSTYPSMAAIINRAKTWTQENENKTLMAVMVGNIIEMSEQDFKSFVK